MRKLCLAATAAFILASFYSCSEDPVKPKTTPPEPIDTVNKYDWNIDTISAGDLWRIYVTDSNNVFIAGYPVALYYNGETYQQINFLDPLFICHNVEGFDKDNVFFGGGTWGTYYGDPVLKKLSNGNVSSYTITNDSGAYTSDIFVDGPNSCWISTGEKYRVHYFNSGQLTSYTLDSGFRAGRFWKDQFGNLFVFPFKTLNDSLIDYRCYEFINNEFQSIGGDTVSPGVFGGIRCGIDFVSMRTNSLLYFNGQGWVSLCNTNFRPRYIGGTSKNNLVCYGQAENSMLYHIYTWNGTKWKQEFINNSFNGFVYSIDIHVKQNTANMIITALYGYYTTSFHFKGKLRVN